MRTIRAATFTNHKIRLQQSNATAPYSQGGSNLSPAKSNCDSKTGCANYSTGNRHRPQIQRNRNNALGDELIVEAGCHRRICVSAVWNSVLSGLPVLLLHLALTTGLLLVGLAIYLKIRALS